MLENCISQRACIIIYVMDNNIEFQKQYVLHNYILITLNFYTRYSLSSWEVFMHLNTHVKQNSIS